MKRCRNRYCGACGLRSPMEKYRIFVAEEVAQEIHYQRIYVPGYLCTDEMAAICEFRDASPAPPKEPSKNPRSNWLQCPYCTTMHRTPETAATCRFFHEEYKLLNGTTMHPWLPEGSKEPWPPYKTSIGDDMVWHYMVDKIIARDGNCCTDCGISAAEVGIIIKGYVPVPYVIGQRYVDTRWSDDEAWRHIKAVQSHHTIEAQKQLPGFEVHHIIPRCQGGTHHPHNLRMLCSTCHRKYTNELMGDLAEQRQREKAVAITLNSFIDSRPMQGAQRSLDIF